MKVGINVVPVQWILCYPQQFLQLTFVGIVTYYVYSKFYTLHVDFSTRT